MVYLVKSKEEYNMSFDEWFENRHRKTGLYESTLCGDEDSIYIKHEMRKAFKAGQKIKQVEINNLKLKLLEVVNSYVSGSDTDDMGEEIKGILNEMSTL